MFRWKKYFQRGESLEHTTRNHDEAAVSGYRFCVPFTSFAGPSMSDIISLPHLASQPGPAPHRHQGIGENPEEAEEGKVGIQDAEQELA
jgi:hypothetical protein